MIPTDEKIAHNIVKEVSTIPNLLEYEAMTLCATKMAQWKNEHFAKEKQKLIENVVKWINDNYFEYLQPISNYEQLKDSIDINAFVNDIK